MIALMFINNLCVEVEFETQIGVLVCTCTGKFLCVLALESFCVYLAPCTGKFLCVLALEKVVVLYGWSMLYYVRIEKSPHILIVIRFNVNRFQCYSMLIQKNIATIFSRSLEFCSWKMCTTADIAGIYLLHPF